ncbi:MAG: hypothetical protein FWH18_02495 [Marinilabiliaceae bacterium]|nr:hypothetical protein [Marinilabiliaceae bacterium]
MKKIIFFIFIFLISATQIFAQFYSKKLQNLYHSLPQSLSLDFNYCDTVVFKDYRVGADTVKIVYEIDKNCFMTHCGFRFFDEIETLRFGKKTVKFLECEMLNLLITNDAHAILENWKNKKVVFQYNNSEPDNHFFIDKQQIVKTFNNATSLSIEKREHYFLVTIVCIDSIICHFAIAINEDLISGMDKKERDDFLAEHLKIFKSGQNHIKDIDTCFFKVFKDSLYVYEGSYYMIPEINNNLYLQKNDSSFSLITSKELAEETFVNSLLLQTDKAYTVNIKHKKYGHEIDYYTVCSNDFFNFFYDDFDNYFGIEQYDKESGKLAGTLIFRNKETDYIHLGYVTCTIENLLQGGDISIELYANIPQNNILNLFGEQNEK